MATRNSLILICVVALTAATLWWLWTPDKDRTALERKYLNAPSDMIDTAGTRLHVRDSGAKTAPAVIFLHGFGTSLHTWEPSAAELEKELRVIRIDLPGSGLSLPRWHTGWESGLSGAY